jgi:hypothetical protein
MDDKDIEIEADCKVDGQIEAVFGRKVALAIYALDWKLKETALKVIYKVTEKYLDAPKEEE